MGDLEAKQAQRSSLDGEKKVDKLVEDSEDSEEIDKKSKIKVTNEMFEAAKLMRNGVSKVQDLDMSLAKRTTALKDQPIGSCEITTIDIMTGEVKQNRVVRPLNKKFCRFDFNSEEDFGPDSDSIEVAKKAFNWILNPIDFQTFKNEIKDKKILIIQNRQGFTYNQDDPDEDLLGLT